MATAYEKHAEEWTRQYVEEGKSTTQIAEASDYSSSTVRTVLRKHGVEIRAVGGGVEYPDRLARFWELVDKEAQPGDCWGWKGPNNGRPCFGAEGDSHIAARVAVETKTGQRMVGGVACHHCDNPECVNPDHLYAGDYKTNFMDMLRRDRHPNFPLTPDDVREIRRRYAAKPRPRFEDLADEYGVGLVEVAKVATRHTYQFVPDTPGGM